MLATLALPILGYSGPAEARVITMGPTGKYSTLAAAVGAASAGATIDIEAGIYVNQDADITVPFTIQGIGSVVFTATGQLSNDKGFLVIDATTTVENLTFEHALADPSSNNGAGIRYQQGNLTVLDSRFIDDQDGILATPDVAGTGTVTVRGSLFQGNGIASGPGSGYAHGLYATYLASLTVTGSSFTGTLAGHDIKSRAANTLVAGNDLDDGVTGTASYAIDLPNGGNARIIANTIDQGPHTSNPTMIAYGEEGLLYDGNSVLIDGNSFANTRPGPAYGVNDAVSSPATAHLTVACNTFVGVSNPAVGAATFTGNVIDGPLPACAITLGAPGGVAALLPGLLVLLGTWRSIRRGGVSPGGPSCAGSSC
jgi:hypothetical protein